MGEFLLSEHLERTGLVQHDFHQIVGGGADLDVLVYGEGVFLKAFDDAGE